MSNWWQVLDSRERVKLGDLIVFIVEQIFSASFLEGVNIEVKRLPTADKWVGQE